MKNKIEVIEDFGIIDKKPLYVGHYEVQKVSYRGFGFFRRQKVRNGVVSSVAYAGSIDSKRWFSKYDDVIINLPKQ